MTKLARVARKASSRPMVVIEPLVYEKLRQVCEVNSLYITGLTSRLINLGIDRLLPEILAEAISQNTDSSVA